MKILMYGFFEEYQINMANSLSDLGHEVIILIPSTDQISPFRLDVKENVKLQYLFHNNFKKEFIKLQFLKKYINIINYYKPDIIHYQVGGGIVDFICLMATNNEIFSTFHDVDLHPGEDKIYRRLIRWYIRNKSFRIFVHGNNLKQLMIKKYKYSSEKIISINFGHTNTSSFIKYIDNNEKEHQNSILFFGRILKYKGLSYLIEACEIVFKTVPNLKVVIAGSGDNIEKYVNKSSHKDNYLIKNYTISHEEGAYLFKTTSIVILPYIEASQSGVVPVAYLFKKPVIVTNVGALCEIVDHDITGIVVPPKDSEAIAKAIVYLLSNIEIRREMGLNGFKKLNEEMSWKSIIKGIEFQYDKLLK